MWRRILQGKIIFLNQERSMEPRQSKNGIFTTFIAHNEERPVFYTNNTKPFEVLAQLHQDLEEETIIDILNLMEQAYGFGFEKGKQAKDEA
jgi:hypothetical protein